MKTKLLFVALLVSLSVLFALTAPVQATKPSDDLSITAQLTIQSETFAEGIFTISSPELGICDSGYASETFLINWDGYTIHGVKTLERAHGTVVLKFRGQMLPTGVVGSFTIISGTGDYLKLHGVGKTNAVIIGNTINAVYEGSAHIN